MSKFGFTVNKVREYNDSNGDFVPNGIDTPYWTVSLPHHCDEWEITETDYGDITYTQEQAISALKEFITEAQEALNSLESGQEQSTNQ